MTSPAAVALTAILVLAACGDADDAPVAQPEPVPTVAGDSTSLRAPTPVEYVSGGSTGGDVATAESAASDGAVTADVMPIAPWSVEYEFGDLPALPTNDVGFVFDTNAEVSRDAVVQVAAAFGLAEEPVLIDERYGAAWRVGPDDGSAPSLWVYGDGQQSWNYQASWADGVVDVACAVSVDSDGNESSDCPEPEPPVGVPSAEEAEQRAVELLREMGVDSSTVRFDTYADEWSANVGVEAITDAGVPLMRWSFGFGAEGVMHYASGSLATPEAVGPYPLIGLDEASARLTDGSYGFGGFGIAPPDIAIAVAEGDVTTSAEAPAAGSETEPAEPSTPAEEPMPVEPVSGEPVVISLVDVEADLWWAWDNDGSVWLLPAYRFIDTDGGWHVVPAVTAEFLIQVEPDGSDRPIPVEPDGGIGDGAEPLPAPEPLPAEPAPAPDAPDVVEEPPGLDPEAAMESLQRYVGLSIEEFTGEAEADGYTVRVVERDGEPLPVTEDYSETRVNVVVEGPRVTAISSIG